MLTKQFNYVDKYYFLLYITCFLVIVFYGKYRCKQIEDHTDILEFNLFKNSNKYGIDGWSITHVLFNAVIGYLYPKALFLSLFLGGLWETFETYVGMYRPNIMEEYGFCSPNGIQTDKKTKVWWYGKKSDIIVNFVGFMIGKTLRENKVI